MNRQDQFGSTLDQLMLRLYVAGGAPNSNLARDRLREIQAGYPGVEMKLEIVDTLVSPLRALEDKVMVTPTLIKLSPEPVVRIVGNLGKRGEVLSALGLPALPAGREP